MLGMREELCTTVWSFDLKYSRNVFLISALCIYLYEPRIIADELFHPSISSSLYLFFRAFRMIGRE